MTSYEFDENATPLDDGEYEYAGDDDEHDMYRVQDDDEEDDDSDDEERMARNNNADQNKSQASYTDEMNLIDYVIEEEKEIGGNKGDDSLSTSRSTTYSKYVVKTGQRKSWLYIFFCSLFSHGDEEETDLTSNQMVSNKKQKIPAKEEGQMIRARAFLNRLDRKVEEKDEIVKRIR